MNFMSYGWETLYVTVHLPVIDTLYPQRNNFDKSLTTKAMGDNILLVYDSPAYDITRKCI